MMHFENSAYSNLWLKLNKLVYVTKIVYAKKIALALISWVFA